MSSTVTKVVLRELVKAVIKAELSVDNKAYPDSLIDDSVNGIYQDTINGTLIDPNTNETVNKTNLTFLEEDVFYSSVQTATLSVLAVVGGNTLSLDTTNYLDSGAVWLEGDLITYTGKTATTLTGVAGIKFAHIGGTKVRQLFTLPDDYNYSTKLWYDYRAEMLPQDYRLFLTRYRNRYYNSWGGGGISYSGGNNQVGRSDLFYTIIRDTYILPITPEFTGKSIQLYYQKGVDDLDAEDDICQIPDKYCKRAIKYIAASNVVADRGELDVAGLWYRRGIKEVKKMYKVESSKTRELQFGTRVGTDSDNTFNI